MRHATPLFDPISYKGATNKRRFYEEVELPRNLVVLGDAVCTFNPAYGQGMTTASLHALALQKQLQVRAPQRVQFINVCISLMSVRLQLSAVHCPA